MASMRLSNKIGIDASSIDYLKWPKELQSHSQSGLLVTMSKSMKIEEKAPQIMEVPQVNLHEMYQVIKKENEGLKKELRWLKEEVKELKEVVTRECTVRVKLTEESEKTIEGRSEGFD